MTHGISGPRIVHELDLEVEIKGGWADSPID